MNIGTACFSVLFIVSVATLPAAAERESDARAIIVPIAKAAYLNPDDKNAVSSLYRTMLKRKDGKANTDVLIALALGCTLHGEDKAAEKIGKFLDKLLPEVGYETLINQMNIHDTCSKCTGTGKSTRRCEKCTSYKTGRPVADGKCIRKSCKNGQVAATTDGLEATTRNCSKCQGNGNCQACGGSGKRPSKCRRCVGSGSAPAKEKVRVAYQGALEAALTRLTEGSDMVFADGREYSRAQLAAANEAQHRAARNEAARIATAAKADAAQAAGAQAAADFTNRRNANAESLGNWVWAELGKKHPIKGANLKNRADVTGAQKNPFSTDGPAYVVVTGQGVGKGNRNYQRVERLTYGVLHVDEMHGEIEDNGRVYVGFNRNSTTATLLAVDAPGVDAPNGMLNPAAAVPAKAAPAEAPSRIKPKMPIVNGGDPHIWN
jgi:hypothetical protein